MTRLHGPIRHVLILFAAIFIAALSALPALAAEPPDSSQPPPPPLRFGGYTPCGVEATSGHVIFRCVARPDGSVDWQAEPGATCRWANE